MNIVVKVFDSGSKASKLSGLRAEGVEHLSDISLSGQSSTVEEVSCQTSTASRAPGRSKRTAGDTAAKAVATKAVCCRPNGRCPWGCCLQTPTPMRHGYAAINLSQQVFQLPNVSTVPREEQGTAVDAAAEQCGMLDDQRVISGFVGGSGGYNAHGVEVAGLFSGCHTQAEFLALAAAIDELTKVAGALVLAGIQANSTVSSGNGQASGHASDCTRSSTTATRTDLSSNTGIGGKDCGCHCQLYSDGHAIERSRASGQAIAGARVEIDEGAGSWRITQHCTGSNQTTSGGGGSGDGGSGGGGAWKRNQCLGHNATVPQQNHNAQN